MHSWICGEDRPSRSKFYLFQKTFEACSGASLSVKVCADSRYRLFLNGKEVCSGPCQGSEHVRYYEEADLSPYLKAGENRLEARVLFVTEEVMITVFRYARPALWISGTLTQNGKQTEFGTDPSWSCCREDAVELFRGCAEVQEAVAPFERVLGESRLTPVEVVRFETPHFERHGFEPYGLRDVYPLAPRPIPPMSIGEPTAFRIVRRGDDYVDLDAGCYTSALVDFTLQAPAGTRVDLIYGECYGKANRHGRTVEKGMRDACRDPDLCICGAFDTVICTGAPLRFRSFWYRAFRYIRVSFPKGIKPELLSAFFQTEHYPLNGGNFTCSDPILNRIWEVSKTTVLCCSHEQYLDCPYFEQRQYDMDSALEMMFAFRLSSDPRLSRKALLELADSQIPDGMIRAHYPSTRVQIIPNFTLFWILMAKDYLLYTGDTETIRTVFPALVKALECFSALRTSEGLIRPTHYWNFVDWVPSWERGVPPMADEEPAAVTSLMAAAAFRAGAALAEGLGNAVRAKEYQKTAEMISAAVRKTCYESSVGLFRDTPSSRTFCQHTSLWAVLSETVVGKDAETLIDHTFHCAKTVEKCTFSMNYYLFRALEKANRYCYAASLFEGWKTMLNLHCTTWCENPDNARSECHGWSSAPIYEFSGILLGVQPASNGFQSAIIQPHPEYFGVDRASGDVPTPYGPIHVDVRREGDHTVFQYEAPPEIRVESAMQ